MSDKPWEDFKPVVATPTEPKPWEQFSGGEVNHLSTNLAGLTPEQHAQRREKLQQDLLSTTRLAGGAWDAGLAGLLQVLGSGPAQTAAVSMRDLPGAVYYAPWSVAHAVAPGMIGPTPDPNVPQIQLPHMQVNTNSPVQGFTAGVVNTGADVLSGFTSGNAVATLPLAGANLGRLTAPVGGMYVAPAVAQIPEQVGQAVQTFQNPQSQPQDKGAAVAAPVINALMGLLAATTHAPKGLSEVEKGGVARETTGTQYKGLLNPPQERGNLNPIQQQAEPIQLPNAPTVADTLRLVQQQLNSQPVESKPWQQFKQGGAQSDLPPEQQAQSKKNNAREAWGDFGGLNKPTDIKLPASDVPKVPEDYAQSEKEAGRGGFVLETPLALADRNTSGFSPDARPDAGQLLGRLENMGRAGKISPSELAYYKEQGLEQFLEGQTRKVTGFKPALKLPDGSLVVDRNLSMVEGHPKLFQQLMREGRQDDAASAQRGFELNGKFYTMLEATRASEEVVKPTVAEVGKWMQENGPKVEVRKFGEGAQNPEQREYMGLVHTFHDELAPIEKSAIRNVRRAFAEGSDFEGAWKVYVEDKQTEQGLRIDKEKARRYVELGQQLGETTGTGDQAHWSFVAPKAEKDMPGYMEVAVTKPLKRQVTRAESLAAEDNEFMGEPTLPEETRQEIGELFPSSHNFPPNTLGFGRGYMETLPNGKKVFHVVEVQSDWAQRLRWIAEQRKLGAKESDYLGEEHQLQDPLLQHHESLVLKALIQHAREQGADSIAVSDAETAMMSEGHDRMMTRDSNTPFTTRRMAEEAVKDLQQQGVEATLSQSPTGTSWIVTQKGRIPQAEGMKLHYDRILPNILEKLTGKKGEVVNFGEHTKARAGTDTTWTQAGGSAGGDLRKDLIFRNPDSTPKSSVTARLYPLDSISARGDQPFTVFGKRYSSDIPRSFTEARQLAPTKINEQARLLGLKDGVTMHEVMNNITKNTKEFGEHNAALADFLTEHFEHVLRTVQVEQGEGFFYHQGRNVAQVDASTEYTKPLVQNVLHEAYHAATSWALEHPASDIQQRVKTTLRGLAQEAQDKLPGNISQFVNDTFRGLYEKVKRGEEPVLSLWKALDDADIHGSWMDRIYSTVDEQELGGQLFGEPTIFDWLNEPRAGDKSFTMKVWDGIKSLLGIQPDSIVDAAFDSLKELGADRKGLFASHYSALAAMGDGLEGKMSLMAPVTKGDVGPGRDLDEAMKARWAKWSGQSAPNTMKASAEVGNKLARFASGKEFAELGGRAQVSGVLGEFQKDKAFDERLGRVVIQDMLNQIKDDYAKNGDTVTPTKMKDYLTPEEFNKALKDPAIKEVLRKHVAGPQVDLGQMHRFLGGDMAAAGKETGAFLNLKNMIDPEGKIEDVKLFVQGVRQGDITNPLERGSGVNMQRKGTGQEYNTSYRYMVERAYKINYEEYAKQKLYDSYVKAGLAQELEPGNKAPTFSGVTAQKVPIIRGRDKAMNLWVRKDLADELYQALQTNYKPTKQGLARIGDVATEIQTLGPTDFVFHMGNMVASLMHSQGAGSAFYDTVRKIPFVGFPDMVWRVGKSMYDVVKDTPELQRELAEISKIGAGRGGQVHEGLVTRLAEKAGHPLGETAKAWDATGWSGRALKFMDKAGRLTADRMFDNLVERGWAKDTEENRREFINRMGQYNERLMTQRQQTLRDYGFSPFVTAGRTFNRLAMQRLLLNPGFRAVSTEVAAKARMVELIGAGAVLFALPIAWNLSRTGQMFPNGMPNMGALAIDKDKDGKWQYMDLLQMNLMRRGLRISGLAAMDRANQQGKGLKDTVLEGGRAVVEGVLNPWEGPVMKSAKVATTGKDFSGFLVSRNPNNIGDNLKAALLNVNPTIATLFDEQSSTGKPGLANTGSKLLQVVGLKQGSSPSLDFLRDAKVQELYVGKTWKELNLVQQARVTKELEKTKSPRTEQQEKSAGEREFWGGWERRDALFDSMPTAAKEWLTKNKLSLPGYKEEETVDREHIALTNKERAVFDKLVQAKYQMMVERLMANPAVEPLTSQQKQTRLNTYLVQARRQAWVQYRREAKK